MKAVPVYQFWMFGTTVRYLQDACVGRRIHGAGMILGNLNTLFRQIEALELRVTERAARELRELQTELRSTESDARLTQPQANQLASLVSSLRKTLEAELMGINAY